MIADYHVFTLRLAEKVYDRIGRYATEADCSVNSYINSVLTQYLEELEKAQEEPAPESSQWRSIEP